jgi:hypothetical protein
MSSGKVRIISTKQCKRARALLKWNPTDLASRTHIPVRHLEKFERNQVRLTKPENDEVVKVFERHGIEFLSDGDAIFHGTYESDYHHSDKEFKHYDLEKDGTETVEDLEAQQKELELKAKEEEEKRLRREREEAERRKKQG